MDWLFFLPKSYVDQIQEHPELKQKFSYSFQQTGTNGRFTGLVKVLERVRFIGCFSIEGMSNGLESTAKSYSKDNTQFFSANSIKPSGSAIGNSNYFIF